jgi:hypothetical protein
MRGLCCVLSFEGSERLLVSLEAFELVAEVPEKIRRVHSNLRL